LIGFAEYFAVQIEEDEISRTRESLEMPEFSSVILFGKREGEI
jgi:hypothetical protein